MDNLNISYISDEDLMKEKISGVFKFNSLPTFYASFVGSNDAPAVRPVIKSRNLYNYAKKHSRTINDGVEVFVFGEYPMDFDRPNQKALFGKTLNTNKKYHNLCNPKQYIDECLCGKKKYVVFPTLKWATWVSVKPIEWIIDDEKQMLISRYKIISIPIKDTNIDYILNNVFLDDIISSGFKKVKDAIARKKIIVGDETISDEQEYNGRHM